MSSGIKKLSLLSVANIGLLALLLGAGAVHAQSSANEVSFVNSSVTTSEGENQPILLERIEFGSLPIDDASALVSVVGGTAEEGTDYMFSSPQVARWNANETGQGSNMLTMTVLNDGDDESDETVIFEIVDVSGDTAIGFPFQLTVTIQNIPPSPNTEIRFQKDSYSGNEGEEVQVALERLLASGGAPPFGNASAIVQVISGGTADNNDVEFSNPTTVSWDNGDGATKFISIPLFDDFDPESTENLFLQIIQVDGDATLGDVLRAEIQILDQYPGELVYVGEPFEVVEGEIIEVEIERVGGSAGQVNVVLGTENNSTDSTDFERVGSGQLNWNDGETGSKSVSYRALSDSVTDDNETFAVFDIDGFRNIGPGSSTVTINDGAPPANAGQVDFFNSVYSGSEADGSIALTLRRSNGRDGEVEVSVNLIGVTATFPDDGSLPGSEDAVTVTWSDDETGIKTVLLSVEQDSDSSEGQERFDLTLDSPTNGLTIGTANPTASVFIDDSIPAMPGVIAFAPEFYTVDEAGDQLTLTVTRTMGSAGVVSADFDFFGGSNTGEATVDVDFGLSDPSNRTLTWVDGDNSPRFINFDIFDDAVFEDTESFSAQLSNLTGGATFDSVSNFASVEITDNDPAPTPGTLSFVSDYTVSESMLSVSLEVTRTGGSSGEVSALYALGESGDSADLNVDYAVSAAPDGELVWLDGDNASKFIDIDITLDTLTEDDEQFVVSILDTTGMAGLGDAFSTVTITDTPPVNNVVSFVNASGSISEDGDLLSIELQRSGASNVGVEVFYELVSGTAILGSDFDQAGSFSGSSGSVFWDPGDLDNRTIDLDIFEDLEAEGDETFTVELSLVTSDGNVTLGTPSTTTITIVDVLPPMPGVLQFDPDAYTVSELDGSVSLSVTRTGGSDGAASILFSVLSGTATTGEDHGVTQPISGTLDWPAGDADPRLITVDIASDTELETMEEFSVSLSSESGAALGSALTATVSISDSTMLDTIVLTDADVSVAEDSGVLAMTVQRVGGGAQAVSVLYSIVSGDAMASVDFGSTLPLNGTVSWTDGDTADKTIEIDITPDMLIESNEIFEVSISEDPSSNPVTIGTPSETAVTITDVTIPMPGVLQFDPDVYSVSEMDGSVELFVTRTGGSDGPASITYTVGSDSAIVGVDHALNEPVSGLLEWPAGDATARSITVDIANDSLIENVESFPVDLSAASGATLGVASSASVNVTDSTVPDSVIMAEDAVTISEDVGVLSIVAQRVGAGTNAVSVNYSISDGTAVSPDDYAATNALTGTINWATGDTADKTIDIDILPDLILESDETLLVSLAVDPLSSPVILGSPSQTLVTITDVAPPMPGFVQFDPDVYTVAESDGLVELIVTRTGGSAGAASVEFEVLADTAEAGSDFAVSEPVSGTLEWPDGDDTPRTITIDVATDALVEGSEEFTALLSAFTGSDAGNATTATITLMDSTEPTPDTIVFADDSIEVDEDVGLVSLVVQRVGAGTDAVSVSYEIADETALSDADYGASEPLTGIVSWAAGDTADKSIDIDVLSDDVIEENETFQVTLDQVASGAETSNSPVLIGTPDSITVTIIDATIPLAPDVIALVDASQTRLESDPMFELMITRTGNGIGDSSVDWVLTPDSASLSDDIDLVAFTGTVNWADGQTGSRLVGIPIINDSLDEPNETLTLSLDNVQGASLGAPASSQLTITDDDEPLLPGSVQFTADTIDVDEDAGSVTLTVTRTAGSAGAITVVASTLPGSAGATDFSAIQTVLSWDDGDTSTREVVVPIAFDSTAESNESFSVVLSGATPDDGVLGSPMTVAVSINDVFNGSRGSVQFASATASVDETDDALTVSVTRVGGTDGAIGVNYSTSADTATAGDDFDTTSGTLTWADGDGAPKTFSIAIAADTLTEAAERFSVTLGNATPEGEASIGTPDTLVITINDVEPQPEPEPVPVTMSGTVQFTSSAISINESAGTVSVTVERSGGTDGAVSVRYDTVADSAIEGDDFQPASGRLQWADGENDVKTLRIAVNIDDDIEDDERFRVVLSDGQPVEAILGTPSSIEITLVDDSIAPPGVLAFVDTELSVAESDGVVELQVARTGGSAGAVSVGYTTVERSADSTDFDPTSGRLSWADGDTSIRTISVPVNRDGSVEAIEQFQVVLAEAQPMGDAEQLGVSLATVSISDSTRLGTLGFLATEMSVSERDRSVTLSVTRSGGSDGSVSVDFAMIESSAESGSDYVNQTGTLNWQDGDVEPRSITVLVNVDNLVEGNEQFIVALSNAQPQGEQQLGETQATITIIDATVPIDDMTTPPIASLGDLDLVVVSGDGQGGVPGDLLEPLVIDVVNLNEDDSAVDGIPIRWRAVPEGSAELLDGARSVSDQAGRTGNRIRILSRGFLNVVATIDVSSTDSTGISTRVRAPEFPVGQGEAVFTVRSGLFAADGLRRNQAAVGASLDAACEVLGVRIEQQQVMSAEEQDLFATCQELEVRLANDDGLAAALDRLLPEELFAIGDSVIDTTDIQVTNVYSRINAIRSGQVETLDISGLNLRHYDQSIPGSVINAAQNELSGGGAAADGALGSSRLAFFVNGSVSYGDVDGGENQSNADVETTGLTIGLDYRATDATVFGAGVGIIENTTEFNPDAGKAEVSGVNLTLFGTYYRTQKGYVDAVLDFGRNSYDITRRINLPNTPDQFGVGDTTADVMSLTVGAGRDFSRGAWEFGPYGRFSYVDADVDGYSERATGSTEGFGSVLNVRAHSVRSTRIALGGQLARTISTTRGVFIPQFRLEAEFEQEDKKEGIQATFQYDPTQTPFTVNGEDRDTSYFNLGIGSSAFFANGRSGFLFYETQLGNDRVTQHFLKLGVRLEF